MTRGEIWKDFFKRTVLPAVIALFLFFMFKNVFTEDGQTNYFYVWLCCGIPFGIRRMFVWLVPHGYDIAGTVGIIALNFILGGIIGGVILIWRLVVAASVRPSLTNFFITDVLIYPLVGVLLTCESNAGAALGSLSK